MLRFENQNKATNNRLRATARIVEGGRLERTVTTQEISRSAGYLAAVVNIRLNYMDTRPKELPFDYTEPKQSSSSGEQAD